MSKETEAISNDLGQLAEDAQALMAATADVAGDKVAARIKREPDAFIMGIVDGWPRNFEAKRARQLGFTTAENTFDDIIRIHIEDELGGKFVD